MCKIHQGKNLAKCDSILKATDVREGVKKKPNLFGTKLWVVGSKGGSKVPNFLVRGGWVGSDVWDKVPNKSVFLTPSLKVVRTADRHHVDYGPSAGPGLGAHRLEELLLPCHRHRPLLPLP